MDGTKSKYPCKPFPYTRFPFGTRYPCRNVSREVEIKQASKVQEPVAVQIVEEPRTLLTTNGVKYPSLKQQCSFPYFRSCRHYCRHRRNRSNFTPKWHRQFLNELERKTEHLVCISPAMKDSYEMLCSIPFCEAEAPVTMKLRKPFNPVHCVFCNKSLYTGGVIYDIHETVPAIKRQSTDQGDDVAGRIGLKTRVTVHKSCFEVYIKRPVKYLVEDDPDECHQKVFP